MTVRSRYLAALVLGILAILCGCGDDTVLKPADTMAPTVWLLSPQNNAVIEGPIEIQAAASDDAGIQYVVFSIDGVELGTDSAAPYAVTWAPLYWPYTPAPTITVRACDMAGNLSAPGSVVITVADLANRPQLVIPGSGQVILDGATRGVDLGWRIRGDHTEAQLQVAADTSFSSLLLDVALPGQYVGPVTHALPAQGPGTYFWRVRVGNGEGDWSRYSAAASFVVPLAEQVVRYGGPACERTFSLTATADGGVAMAVLVTERDDDYNGRTSLVKYGHQGLDWSMPVLDDGRIYAVRQASDGGYLLGGWDGNRPVVVRTDASGRETLRYNPRYPFALAVRDVQERPDGAVLAVANCSARQLYVACHDAAGAELWQTYRDYFGIVPGEMVVNADSSCVVLGDTGQGPDQGLKLVKLGGDGEILWTRELAGNTVYGNGGTSTLAPCSDGGFFITAISTLHRILVLRTDAQGSVQWYRTISLGSPAEPVDEPYGGIEDAAGGFVVVGATRSLGVGDYDAFLIKLDPSGNAAEPRVLGGIGPDLASRVVESRDLDGYVVAGWTNANGWGGSQDVFVLQTDHEGLLKAGWAR